MTASYVELKDKYGNAIGFGHVGDLLIPPFSSISDFRQHRDAILEMDLKTDDVIICGFQKTGNVEYHDQGARYFLDHTPMEKVPNPPGSPPRVLHSHLKFHHLPKKIFEEKTKLIYLERNPKDTWVSLYNHTRGRQGAHYYGGTWNQFFDLMISGFGYWYGDWFDYVKDWENEMQIQNEVPIFISVYEDLKKDPVGQIERLDEFLGTNRGRQLCEEIADACSFSKLKEAKDARMSTEQKKSLFNEDSQGFYRKGDVGDWKNWFTVAQNELFDEVYKKRMAGSSLRYACMN